MLLEVPIRVCRHLFPPPIYILNEWNARRCLSCADTQHLCCTSGTLLHFFIYLKYFYPAFLRHADPRRHKGQMRACWGCGQEAHPGTVPSCRVLIWEAQAHSTTAREVAKRTPAAQRFTSPPCSAACLNHARPVEAAKCVRQKEPVT